MDESNGILCGKKKSSHKGTYYKIPLMSFQKRQNYSNSNCRQDLKIGGGADYKGAS